GRYYCEYGVVSNGWDVRFGVCVRGVDIELRTHDDVDKCPAIDAGHAILRLVQPTIVDQRHQPTVLRAAHLVHDLAVGHGPIGQAHLDGNQRLRQPIHQVRQRGMCPLVLSEHAGAQCHDHGPVTDLVPGNEWRLRGRPRQHGSARQLHFRDYVRSGNPGSEIREPDVVLWPPLFADDVLPGRSEAQHVGRQFGGRVDVHDERPTALHEIAQCLDPRPRQIYIAGRPNDWVIKNRLRFCRPIDEHVEDVAVDSTRQALDVWGRRLTFSDGGGVPKDVEQLA